jgi:hypothetical protein
MKTTLVMCMAFLGLSLLLWSGCLGRRGEARAETTDKSLTSIAGPAPAVFDSSDAFLRSAALH